MELKRYFCLALFAAVPAAAQVGIAERLHDYGMGLIGVQAWLGSAASAGVGQWDNSPEKWGQGAEGYGKRFASRFGQNIAKQTLQLPAAALLHEDLRYHPSKTGGTRARLGYAIKRSFIVPRSNGMGNTFAYSRLISNFGGGLISRTWQPSDSSGVGDGFASGAITLGGDVGINIVREFWPGRKK
jgi:hypothetical protein